jgi:hypothetical protein
MSYEDASRREIGAFEELRRVVTERGYVDATAAIYSEHRTPYEVSVERLLAAVQAYQAASSDLLKAAQQNAG